MCFLEKVGTLGFCESKIEKFRHSISDETFSLMFDIIFETGCSPYELVSIKPKHIDYSKNEIILLGTPKKEQKYKSSISKGLVKRIKQYISKQEEDYMFISARGKQYSRRRIEQLFSSHSKQIQIKITPKFLSKVRENKKSLSNISQTQINEEYPSSERDFLIMSIVEEVGCKTSEISALKCKDIVNCRIMLTSPKREIEISDTLSRKLQSFLKRKEKNDFIFSGKSAQPISSRRIQQVFSDYSKKAHTKITAGILRKRAIQKMARKGESISKIKEKMGIGTVNRFTHGVSGVDELRR